MAVLQVMQGEGTEYADCILVYQRAFLMWQDGKSCMFSSLAGTYIRMCICIPVALLSQNLKSIFGTCVLVSGNYLL